MTEQDQGQETHADEAVSPFRQEAGRAAILKALHKTIGEEYDKAMKGEGSLILKELLEQQKKTGGQTVPVDLPGMGKVASITLPMNQDSITVDDEVALLRWVKAWMPDVDVVETIERVRPAFVAALRKRVIGDYKSGDVFDPVLAVENKGEAVKVLGMTAVPGQGHGTPQVKLNPGAADRIVDVVIGTRLPELTSGKADTTAMVVDADGVVDAQVVGETPYEFGPPGCQPTEFIWPLTRSALDSLKRPVINTICEDFDIPHTGNLPTVRGRIIARQDEVVAPGVTFIEAFAAAMHARLVQRGFSTWQIEADRIAADRDPSLRARQEHANDVGAKLVAKAKEEAK